MTMKTHKITFKEKDYSVVDAGGMWFLETQDACMNKNGVLQQSKFIRKLVECVQPAIALDDLSAKEIMELGELLQECFSE